MYNILKYYTIIYFYLGKNDGLAPREPFGLGEYCFSRGT